MDARKALVCAVLVCSALANAQSSGYVPPSPPAYPSQPTTAQVQPNCSSGVPGVLSVAGRGMISISISVTNSTAEAARAAAADQTNRVVSAVTQVSGVLPANLSTSSLSISPQRNYSNGLSTITAYQFSNTLSAQVPASAASAVLDAAVTAAMNISISSVSFSLSPALAYNITVTARQQAAADAKATAQQYADTLGVKLGPLLSVTDTSTSSTPIQSSSSQLAAPVQRTTAANDSSSSSTPLSVGPATVSASITAFFTICTGSGAS